MRSFANSFGLEKVLGVPEPDFPDYIVVKRSPRAKRLALRLDPQKRVFNLIIPKRVSLRRAQDFAIDNEPWMQKRLAELPNVIAFNHGTQITIAGKPYKIEVAFDPALKRTSIKLEDGVLTVKTNKEDPSGRIMRFLKEQARTHLEKLSHEKAAHIGKTIKSVSIRDTKSRWGSCSADGSLSYSWRLILAPYKAMDYVVGHEVAHLVHLDHSKKFWALCKDLSDDYVEGKYWMRNHAHELMRYGARNV